MFIDQFNAASEAEARRILHACCTASRWVDMMLAARPVRDVEHIHAHAARCWAAMAEADYLEAFAGHPRIGEKAVSPSAQPQSGAALAAAEQSGVAMAEAAVLTALADLNDRYFDRFGFIFIVCATAKSAAEMLALLQARYDNARATELAIAAAEQAKITAIRIDKIFR